MTDDLTDPTSLPGRVQAELTRLRAERDVFTAEQERLKAKLAEADETADELRRRIDTPDPAVLAVKEQAIGELGDKVELLQREHDEISARAAALAADVVVARRERDSLRAELASCREDRDRMRLALLDAELVLSAGGLDGTGAFVEASTGDQTPDRQRLFVAERRAAEMARELDATRRTISWRVTAPLRVVRKKMDRP